MLPVGDLTERQTSSDPSPAAACCLSRSLLSATVLPCGLEEQRETDSWGFMCIYMQLLVPLINHRIQLVQLAQEDL